eukprot:CAMPEP_0172834218 /NCGR_PEP_ID=MMETSP1075-20121228/24900_1 /TAXON_ID=2916 /ORGANISM="Ceratium fusus, Strain PA161109" /LENGTH=50 /DNA_ID=CAMNT_0013677093 /DNA_START=595 /DNA_END=747 /DNA_ORIENTATION=+
MSATGSTMAKTASITKARIQLASPYVHQRSSASTHCSSVTSASTCFSRLR